MLISNKKAYYDYEVLEIYEAGLILTGPEVKSIRMGQATLAGGYIVLDKNKQAWLNNINIASYPPAAAYQTQIAYQSSRPRKLLLKKKEITSLIGKTQIKGLSLIPLKIYTKNKFIKVAIGLCRGKKKWDKKEKIKQREMEKRIRERLRG